MRVIAGSAGSLKLKTPEGMDTRPTTDRIKETLFNMISPYLCDCNFLDLFGGSGAIGIKALSRGAKRAVFVEKNPKAVACIRENLQFTKLEEKAEVIAKDALSAIGYLEGRGVFDYIFLDPPYLKGMEREVLQKLKKTDIVGQDTVIIIEAALETDFSWLLEEGYHLIKIKKYKTNMHVFVEKEGDGIC